MFVFGGEACAIQPEVRYFRTSNRIFPGSFVSRPLVKGNEDPGYEGEGQGDKKLVYRLIELFSSTEIFSKFFFFYLCSKFIVLTNIHSLH